MSCAPTRPLLRWYGGKWKLANWIISHFPPHRVYVEPYGGAASVLLQKPRAFSEVYNDLNSEVVNLFRVVRDRGEELQRVIELTPFSREELDLSYSPADDPVEQARRTVLRSFASRGAESVSGVYRSGFRSYAPARGAMPARDWRNLPGNVPAVIERLRGVVIENRNAIEVMQMHDVPEALYYVDPPYVMVTRTRKRGYLHEMDNSDHLQLAEVLHSLKGRVVLSGYASELYDQLYLGWDRVERRTMADGAIERVEFLWLSPNCRQGGLLEGMEGGAR